MYVCMCVCLCVCMCVMIMWLLGFFHYLLCINNHVIIGLALVSSTLTGKMVRWSMLKEPQPKIGLHRRRSKSGWSGFGRTTFIQGKNKISFLPKASNEQKC